MCVFIQQSWINWKINGKKRFWQKKIPPWDLNFSFLKPKASMLLVSYHDPLRIRMTVNNSSGFGLWKKAVRKICFKGLLSKKVSQVPRPRETDWHLWLGCSYYFSTNNEITIYRVAVAFNKKKQNVYQRPAEFSKWLISFDNIRYLNFPNHLKQYK